MNWRPVRTLVVFADVDGLRAGKDIVRVQTDEDVTVNHACTQCNRSQWYLASKSAGSISFLVATCVTCGFEAHHEMLAPPVQSAVGESFIRLLDRKEKRG